MHKLIVKIEKDFCNSKWNVLLGSKNQNYLIPLIEPFEFTHPNPGAVLETKEIVTLIEFLQKTLEEPENEQSNLERLEECDS